MNQDELLSMRRALWGTMAVAVIVIVLGVAGGELRSPFRGALSSKPGAPSRPSPPQPPQTPSPAPTTCPTGAPPARAGASAAYDPDRHVVVLFGGLSTTAGSLADTWTWDGACWKEVPDPAPPGPRREAAMAYDAVDHEVVLFGGDPRTPTTATAPPFENDTWTWDGSWHRRSPPTSPQFLSAAAVAYPTGVLLAGFDQSSQLMQTWTWKAGQWTQLGPAHEPTPRVGQAMAWSPRYQAVLLFGGSSNASGMLGETWIWRGGDWNQISAGGSGPEARNGASLCLDAHSGDLLLIEGTLGVPQGDHAAHATTQWLWNGSSWELSQPPLPPDRFYVTAVSDPDRGQIVAYSGSAFDPGTGQLHGPSGTWVWDGTTWAQR